MINYNIARLKEIFKDDDVGLFKKEDVLNSSNIYLFIGYCIQYSSNKILDYIVGSQKCSDRNLLLYKQIIDMILDYEKYDMVLKYIVYSGGEVFTRDYIPLITMYKKLDAVGRGKFVSTLNLVAHNPNASIVVDVLDAIGGAYLMDFEEIFKNDDLDLFKEHSIIYVYGESFIITYCVKYDSKKILKYVLEFSGGENIVSKYKYVIDSLVRKMVETKEYNRYNEVLKYIIYSGGEVFENDFPYLILMYCGLDPLGIGKFVSVLNFVAHNEYAFVIEEVLEEIGCLV